jgi:thioredoxin-like negative regulator of GroEL
VLVAVAVAVALIVERRRPDAPTQSRTWPVPTQLDRRDFASPETPWLVAVFSSATCQSCAKAVGVAQVMASDQVAVDDVEVGARKDVHDRYGIEAVPTIVVADADGVVRASFVGPPTATDLWAAVAEVREPGSTPGECSQHFGAQPPS